MHPAGDSSFTGTVTMKVYNLLIDLHFDVFDVHWTHSNGDTVENSLHTRRKK